MNNTNLKVICISGKARSGKDTSAEALRKILWGYGKRVLFIHNADLLKYICKTLFLWDGKKDERGRHILQYVGTDIVRAQRPDFWVDYIISVLTLFGDSWDYVLIPDCRFPNEIDRLKASSFNVTHLRIIRDDYENGLTEDQENHPSETALDHTVPDFTVSNNGTMCDLISRLMKIAVHFEGGLW